MPPAERTAHFKASVIHDLDQTPERYRTLLDAQTARILEREERLRGAAS